MTIRSQFNIGLLAVLVPGAIAILVVIWGYLIHNAKSEVLRNGGVMMETALSVRGYTVDHIKPHLDPLNAHTFLPETVPSFSAMEVFRRLQASHPEYTYREATLNPTNPGNKANDWEHGLIANSLRLNTAEAIGEHTTADGRTLLYIARPIKITDGACLRCHSTPEAAPASMLAKYGRFNGFGWKLNDVVGAQIIYVPTDLAMAAARDAFYVIAGMMCLLVLVLFGVLNWMLDVIVVRTLRNVSGRAEEISRGDLSIPEFSIDGATEIRQLKQSFNRMRRSIERAMQHMRLGSSGKES